MYKRQIVNYACHPTTLAWDSRALSPDYVGAMRETVQTRYPAPCLFLQGASGDLGPRDGFVGDREVADRNGRWLGYAALTALESTLPPERELRYAGGVTSGTTIGVWEATELAADRQRGRAVMLELLRRGVFLNPMGTKLYLSLAHGENEIDELAAHFAAALQITHQA